MTHDPKRNWTYKDAGVDIDEGGRFIRDIAGIVRSTHGPRVVHEGARFAGLFALNNQPGLFRHNYRDPVLVACADGVGTKLKIAFEMGVHRTVGIDLVAMNVDDLVVCGAEPLFFVDYIATARKDRQVLTWVMEGIAEGCRQSGMAILGGETAELPGFYRKGEYDLAGFAVGVVERRKILTGDTVEPGDVVLGIASNGLHSNGYSLARAVLEDFIPELDDVLGEVLLCPTLIYAPLIAVLLRGYKVKKVIKAFAHVTGSGLPGNLARVLPDGLRAEIDPSTWPKPPIFDLIRKTGGVPDGEMYRVFNMGIGFCAVVSPFFADSILRKIERSGYRAFRIGGIVKGERGLDIKGVEHGAAAKSDV
jgi:phosphoribosylformylglycinamidine cyclo-ligase